MTASKTRRTGGGTAARSSRGRLHVRRRDAAALLGEGRYVLAADAFLLLAEEARSLREWALEAGALIDRGVALRAIGRPAPAVEALLGGLVLARRWDLPGLESLASLHLGWIAEQRGEARLGLALLELAWRRRLPDDAFAAEIALRAGSLLARLEQLEAALAFLREAAALAAARADGDITRLAVDLEIAWVEARLDNASAQSRGRFVRAVEAIGAVHLAPLRAIALQHLADLALRAGQPQQALELCDEAVAFLGGPMRLRRDDLGILRLKASAEAATARWQDAARTLERLQAVRESDEDHFRLVRRLWDGLSLATGSGPQTPHLQPKLVACGLQDLTPAEVDILRMLSHGQTNREIAEHVGKAANTVRNQVTVILRKLGVTTRTAAAALVLGRGASPAGRDPTDDGERGQAACGRSDPVL